MTTTQRTGENGKLSPHQPHCHGPDAHSGASANRFEHQGVGGTPHTRRPHPATGDYDLGGRPHWGDVTAAVGAPALSEPAVAAS
ncbi:hypothetical protein KPATCC21470_3633 [Kitasatospora purpeofusca]